MEETMNLRKNLILGNVLKFSFINSGGWAYRLNVWISAEGPFPLAATVPLCGIQDLTDAKFKLINCVHSKADLFRENILFGAAYASTGGILSVTH
ncbi:hypothetical protein HK096_009750, partial [Nowakowskiella sp. JEL0078]